MLIHEFNNPGSPISKTLALVVGYRLPNTLEQHFSNRDTHTSISIQTFGYWYELDGSINTTYMTELTH